MQVIPNNLMNKNAAKIALQAWNEHVSVNAEAEEWMAGYINRVIKLTVESCANLLTDDTSCIDKFGKDSTNVLNHAVEILTKHFEDNEKTN